MATAAKAVRFMNPNRPANLALLKQIAVVQKVGRRNTLETFKYYDPVFFGELKKEAGEQSSL